MRYFYICISMFSYKFLGFTYKFRGFTYQFLCFTHNFGCFLRPFHIFLRSGVRSQRNSSKYCRISRDLFALIPSIVTPRDALGVTLADNMTCRGGGCFLTVAEIEDPGSDSSCFSVAVPFIFTPGDALGALLRDNMKCRCRGDVLTC